MKHVEIYFWCQSTRRISVFQTIPKEELLKNFLNRRRHLLHKIQGQSSDQGVCF